ncbi:GMC oxidoreductase [Sphaerobolus stellatus SS14]|uniref:GMC oxidoreductase n=1 Tax=Sphaerobolus stellatus (strain SS14) TaxID=990650 RepID=A0A0C9UN04_SPHS4|nr:GMC oxidoreductase [Sphaerobolus stellatus SS14]
MANAALSDVADKTFDYIIVGGGTAGLTLAATLSQDPSISVVVLEAGEPNLDDPNILLLGQCGYTFGDPKYDWEYKTVPQQYSSERRITWNRGKGLGGTSGLNFCNWTLPSAQDVDAIEKLGNPGWNWEEFEKYAHRIEKFQEPTPEKMLKYLYTYTKDSHGHNGAIKTSFPAGISVTLEIPFLQAMNSIGIPFTDAHGGEPLGVFVCPVTMDPTTHTRSYAANSYYVPNRNRQNLKVLTGAHVAKVLFSDDETAEDLIATGVEFFFGNDTSIRQVVYANREVVLCAGTIISPQLLELSGIGRKEVLEAIGVQLKLELPGVGENLQDHQITNVNYQLDDQFADETWDQMRDPVFAAEQRRLQIKGEGFHCWGNVSLAYLPFSTVNSEEANVFFTKAASNVQKQLASPHAFPGLAEQLELQLQTLRDPQVSDVEFICLPGAGYYSLQGIQPGKKHLAIFTLLEHPFSRGSVHCKTSDPLQPPDIDPRIFENDTDLDIIVEQIKFVRKLVDVEPLKSVVKREIDPGPERQSDEEIREFIKLTHGSTWHACGSCSMLPHGKNGVVDPNLKVYGTRNLRVADLSIIPLEPLGHTQSIAYIVGMKAADILLAERNQN